MRLPKPFFQLPIRVDAARLRQEVADIPGHSWVPHPNGIEGNSSVRLISVDGAENDGVDGIMRETPHLSRLPYVRQILSALGVVWSRTRLLRLAPGAVVPPHADINYHWFYRVRVHIPVVTRPEVQFHCDGTSVHMAAGEAWVFDNWRLHNVVNPTPDERIHLVADTAGNGAFWQAVYADSPAAPATVDYSPDSRPRILTEHSTLHAVMNPAELEMLVGNLRGELIGGQTGAAARQLSQYHALLEGFVRDWRQIYLLHGESAAGWVHFIRLRDAMRAASRSSSEGIVARTNRVAVHQILEARILRVCIREQPKIFQAPHPAGANRLASKHSCLQRPVFIVAAPRSGSTLLFETLAASSRIATLGGEAHWLVEGIPELKPGAPGVSSNRLTEANATAAVGDHIRRQLLERLVDSDGNAVIDCTGLEFLEKTPKNSLRIPFFNRLFPQARFIFLWREPRGNVSSIIEAWKSGKWQTYRMLEGFERPWSLLLPPGWQDLREKPLEQVAAFQWNVTNSIILDDLSDLPRERWLSVDYEGLVASPEATIQRICRRLEIEFDASLRQHLTRPLPAARHTLTPPSASKWQENAAAIERVLPTLVDTWKRLQSLPKE
jgi:hypothetical protein